MSLENIKKLAEIFQALAVGLSAIVAAVVVLPDIWNRYLKNQRIIRLRNMFPRSQLNSSFAIINNPHSQPGHIFILNEKTHTKHWVANPETISDMGLNYADVTDVSIEHFESFLPGREINTRSNYW